LPLFTGYGMARQMYFLAMMASLLCGNIILVLNKLDLFPLQNLHLDGERNLARVASVLLLRRYHKAPWICMSRPCSVCHGFGHVSNVSFSRVLSCRVNLGFNSRPLYGLCLYNSYDFSVSQLSIVRNAKLNNDVLPARICRYDLHSV
jgi:hypothetical protein